jgi:hypothetical protein
MTAATHTRTLAERLTHAANHFHLKAVTSLGLAQADAIDCENAVREALGALPIAVAELESPALAVSVADLTDNDWRDLALLSVLETLPAGTALTPADGPYAMRAALEMMGAPPRTCGAPERVRFTPTAGRLRSRGFATYQFGTNAQGWCLTAAGRHHLEASR